MVNMRLYTVVLISCCFLTQSFAQTDTIKFPNLAIGSWQQHLPWQRSVYVTQSDQKVYFATDWAILEVDKTDRSSRYITKVEGLSDVGMGLIRFSRATGILLAVYSNSNIDLYKPADKSVTNLPFLKKNINIVGDKKIYNVAFDGHGAFLACGFGILKLNLDQGQVDYTTFTNVAVKSFALFNGYLYAGTAAGLYRLPADDQNPADFGRWVLLGATQGIPSGSPITALTASGNELYVGIGNTLYQFDGNTGIQIATDPNRKINFLTSEGPGVVIGWTTDDKGIVEYLDANGTRSQINHTCGVDYPLYAIEDGVKKIWLSDQNDLFPYYDMVANTCDLLKFNSPLNQQSSEIAIGGDGKTYIGTPGPNATLASDYLKNGVYVYNEGQWDFWNQNTMPELVDTSGSYNDMWRVIVHPTEDKQYVGSWVGGLLQFSGGKYVKKYTKANSILQGAGQSGNNRTAIGGMAFDANNNLWFSNYNAGAPIAVLKADGTLRNFSASPANGLLNVAIDQNGYKWFVIAFNSGILVYDSGQDLDSPADDRYRVITSANSALPTNSVNCISVDLDGDVWVGTQQGVVSFECGSSVFDNSCNGRRRIVNVDGFNGYLLETEDVRSIAVDGGNRKWFGTTNGVFVQSPDALTQVAYFKDTNSPLFDNTITDIAINNKTGEAWIGTEKGVISYRGEATTGGAVNTTTPYAYPNPVRPDYDGPIAIYGLGRDANVKITDVSGNLVYEGKALGGQAIWNARDYLGRRVASGVYLIFATSASLDTPDAVIAKVVVLN
jgi:ligand-binding sensor domain-containing protein